MSKNIKAINKDGLPANKEKRIRSRSYSRTKGHNSERKYAKLFRELGFSFCKTSREASTLLDDSGVDLAHLPLNIQIKCGYWKFRPKPDEIFKNIQEKLTSNYPTHDPLHKYPKVLIHELDGKNVHHQLVTMNMEDWIPFLMAYKTINNL